ncbi:MAG: hypothetical protein J6C98_10305 [Oscillospiraceae bacterium]|nr:hypothetical protein [Oscillospiraceae bacterium]
MKLVQKGNKQLRIADDQLANYLARGFDEVDQKTGKIIKKEGPADELKALKKENATLKKTNKELTEQLEQLKAGQ